MFALLVGCSAGGAGGTDVVVARDAQDATAPPRDVDSGAPDADAVAPDTASEVAETADDSVPPPDVPDQALQDCLDACGHTVVLGCGPTEPDAADCAELCGTQHPSASVVACVAAAPDCDGVVACIVSAEIPPEGCDLALPPAPSPPASLSGAFTYLPPADPAALDALPLYRSGVITAPGNFLDAETSGVFGDLDGDGVTEYVATSTSEGTPVVFRYDAAASQLVDTGTTPFGVGTVLLLEDLDGDGATDALVAGSQGRVVMWGDGAGGLDATPLFAEGVGSNYRLTVLSIADLDSDGLLDLLLHSSSKCCTLDCPDLVPVIRTGLRQWSPRPESMASVNHANLTSLLAAPIGDAELAIFGMGSVGCGGPYQGFYKRASLDPGGMPRFAAYSPLEPALNAKMLTLTPMGAAVADGDGDGVMDLTLTLDPLHGLYRGRLGAPLEDLTATSRVGTCGQLGTLRPDGVWEALVPWGAAWLDLDRDGRPDLVYAHGPDPGTDAHGMFPQPVTAHWNAGDWRYSDMTAQVGLDAVGLWRGLVVDDLDGDGDPDFAVGGLAQLPWLLRNDIVTPNHGLAIRLRGTTSNSLGVGAIIDIESTGVAHAQHVLVGSVGNAGALSRPMAFAGLGAATEAAVVRIHWPSGYVQEERGLAAGKVHVIAEHPSIEVTPPSRHLPAGGAQTAVIRALARNPDGTLRPDAKVEIRVAFGGGSFDGPAVADGGGWRRGLVAPEDPGSTVVEVLIDGVPLRVRPRIFWD
ncbi:MAG: CRTAC1 family protein [Myxococcota bacterium]